MSFVQNIKKKYMVVSSSTKPAVYVGTYSKYNSGSIKGKWLNLEDYASKEDFLKAAAALHKDEPDAELMFQDFEGFPRQYYSESSLSDELWDWLDLDEDDRELLAVYSDELGDDKATIEQARDAFWGKFDSKKDWAMSFLEDSELSAEQAANYLTLTDTDARVRANEDAYTQVENMGDEDVLKEADLEDEYDEAEGDKAKEKILNKAKEEVESQISDEIEEKLKKDPVGYLTDETGMYTVEELSKQNFMSIDYDLYVRDAEMAGDVSFAEKGGNVWVFSNH
jgi:antirestriction protein